ncbi:hypothetical protein CMV30_12675 [Nibricoccus aquaticus]|uniref:Methyltransferase domain-containing protein n=1 Tax=Nibricoccus aquaticus TaxID=2576891 RepID=A0A290Q928_9BACT|nr:class I SAM-dependent methyltransferase [Nibricoccus aquaticus]ATC64747.1 hypothetical protein CMV30_12675 [Nibricoccus aquaticus]
MQKSDDPDFIHKEHPKRFARDDFWSQIKRTVNGQPVSEHDIQLIVGQIERHIHFSATSHLLDIGCGNGALAARLFQRIAKYTGVDFSPYLLEIAREYFRPNENVAYIESDARAFVTNHTATQTIDKVMLYGCMSYFSRDDFRAMSGALVARFHNVDTVFLGNVPDISSAADFFAARQIASYELGNPHTPIGVWWAQQELVSLGTQLGFSARCVKMPPEFYGHRYRFDVIWSKRHEASQ